MTRDRLLGGRLGPGLAIAATGVGAGDLLAAMLAGADFGAVLGWAIIIGAVLKLCLNEGVARWQLATGTTLLDGWCRHLGAPARAYFLVYLVVWSFIVAAGLMSACGIAAHALVPALTVRWWAVLHSLAGVAMVLAGRYGLFEQVMKAFVGVMVVTLLGSVLLVGIDPVAALRGLVVPTLPAGSAGNLLSLMGGVGGSVTLLAYGYWIRERGWTGPATMPTVRLDLTIGYVVTGLFGVATLLLAAAVLGGRGAGMPEGSAGLVACADAVGDAAAGRFGDGAGLALRTTFLVGVWAAVATSLLGVWQGVPYLAADFLRAFRGRAAAAVDTRSWVYRGYLLYLAVPPMLLLLADRPVWLIRTYTVTSGLFMPFLAGSLLWLLTRRRLLGGLASGSWSIAGLVAGLALFLVLALRELADLVG